VIFNRSTDKSIVDYTLGLGKLFSIIIFILFGFVLSVTQLLGESPDYSQYEFFFDLVRADGMSTLETSRFEPGFSIFAVLLTTIFTSNVIVYSWIVLTALLLKGWTISVYSPSQKIFLVVAVFYLSRYFSLHELTQLRAACGIGFLLVAAVLFWREKFLYGMLASAVAFSFHMSTLAVVPVLLYQPRNRLNVIIISITVYFFLSSGVSFIADYLANYIKVFEAYQIYGAGDKAPNPLSVVVIFDLIMLIISLIMWDRLSLLMKRIVYIELIGIVFYYGIFDFPVIAQRMREMFSVFWIFYIIDGLKFKSTKILVVGFAFVSIVLYTYIFLSGEFFH
jgi:hypothetical protein